MNLRIEKAVYGGDGLARSDGKAVFVAGTLPGELVEATIATDKKSFSTGRLGAVLEPSPERVTPGCGYVPRCGGCQYQHANPAFQVQMKLDILRETFERAHVPVPEKMDCVSGPAWGYRNRIRLHGAPGGVGYRERASHRVLRVTGCPIAAPLLEKAIPLVQGQLEEIEFFTNGSQVLVSVWPGRVKVDLEAFSGRLKEKLPELAGVGLFLQNRLAVWGADSLQYEVLGVRYEVSLGSFFQVNRFLVPELVGLVTGDRQGETAWDLYAGVGLFAGALGFENVTAVESEGFSSQDLKRNLPRQRVVGSSTLQFLRGQRVAPELVVVDPPRAGLGKEVCGELERLGAGEIVYVSCDPATLARDLQSLLRNGYGIDAVTLVDLFPQTFHMETVVSLKRG